MLPNYPANDLVHMAIRQPKTPSYVSYPMSFRVHLPDFENIAFRDLAASVVFTFRRMISMLGNAVRVVVLMSSKEQMSWIAARRIVAVMANNLSIWNIPVEKSPRKPVCVNFSDTNSECSVPSIRSTSNPRPAVMRTLNVYLAPKSFFDRFASHISVRLICATLPARQSAGAFSL